MGLFIKTKGQFIAAVLGFNLQLPLGKSGKVKLQLFLQMSVGSFWGKVFRCQALGHGLLVQLSVN